MTAYRSRRYCAIPTSRNERSNINLGRECVREIVVNKIDVEAVSEELRSILEGGSARAKMLADFAELQEMTGGEGSSHRTAKDIVKSLK